MSARSDCTLELHDLLERLVERELTATDWTRLNALLAEGPMLRRYYRDFFRLHCELESEFQADISVFGSQVTGALGHGAPLSRPPAAAAAPLVPPISTVHQPVAVLHGFFGGAILSYAFVALLMGVGVLGAWTWNSRPGIVPSLGQQDVLRDPSQIVGQITKMIGCRWANPAAAPADAPTSR